MFTCSPTVSFDIFVHLYVFGAIALVLLSLIAHLLSSLLDVVDEVRQAPLNGDFYEQVTQLLASSKAPNRNRLGSKSRSQSRHFELITAL